MLHAQPAEFASAITDIDAELRRKIDQLTDYRRPVAELAGGERLVLPPEVVLDQLIDDMDAWEIKHERDGKQPAS